MRLLSLILVLAACGEKPASTANEGSSTVSAIPEAAARMPAPAPGAGASSGDIAPETVIATWSGGQLTYGELEKEIRGELTRLESDYLTERYGTQSEALEGIMLEKLLEAEAKKRGLADANALIEAEVRAKVPMPTDKEVEAFYPQVQRQLRNAPLEEVRDQVAGALKQRNERDRFFAFVDELKKASKLTTSLPFPNLPRFEVSIDDDPMKGNKDAKVTIVQFAEFQCPYCGKARDTVDQVLKDYDGKVRMVFRDFPLANHGRATPAAVAANCAGKQGKYWELFDQMMTNQRALEDADLERYATAAGVNLETWKTCLQDPAEEAEVMADQQAGAALGVSGTPAFFINGIMLSGALPYDQFKAIIDRELAGT